MTVEPSYRPDYEKHYALMRQWSGVIGPEGARTLLDASLIPVEPDIEAAGRALWAVLRLAEQGYLDDKDDAVLYDQARFIIATAYPKENNDG